MNALVTFLILAAAAGVLAGAVAIWNRGGRRVALAAVALVVGAGYWAVTFHRDGMARVRAAEARETARREAAPVEGDVVDAYQRVIYRAG